MKQISFIIPDQYNNNKYSGFYHKYLEINSYFSELGYQTRFLRHNSKFGSIIKVFNLINHSEYIWLRSPGIRLWLFLIIIKYKKLGNVILEFPDPFFSNVILKENKFSIRQLKIYFELILSLFAMLLVRAKLLCVIEYSNESEIVGQLLNLNSKGVLLSNPVPRILCNAVKYGNNIGVNADIKFVCVADFQFWHGIDRFLNGMKLYINNLNNANININLTLIGNLNDYFNEKLLLIIQESKLTNYVKILGHKDSTELSVLLTNYDIGIGSIGIHRTGCRIESSLKTGLYCAIGLPFISCGFDPRFDVGYKYRFEIDSTDEPVDIKSIVDWWLSLDAEIIPMAMHNFYENKLTGVNIYGGVMKFLND